MDVIQYSDQHKDMFIQLNQSWMKEYELVDDLDPMLIDPEKSILENGGQILLAELNGEIIGSVALISRDENSFEIAKLAVKNEYRSKGYGKTLLLKALEFAKKENKRQVLLESSTKLKAALKLYRSLGFREIDKDSVNQCDLRMQLKF